MKTTIEILDEIGIADVGVIRSQYVFDIERLEQFRLAVEADFVSRCEFAGYKVNSARKEIQLTTFENTPLLYSNDDFQNVYTLPKETK